MNLISVVILCLVLVTCAKHAQCQSSYSIATKGSPSGTPGSYFCSITSPGLGCQTWLGGATFTNATSSSFMLGLLYSNKDGAGSNYFDHWLFNPASHSLTYYLSNQNIEPCSIQGYSSGQISYTCPAGKVVVDVTVEYW